MALGFPDRLEHVLLDSLAKAGKLGFGNRGAHRPGPEHRLVKQVLVVGARPERGADPDFPALVPPRPPPQVAGPFAGNHREHVEPGADVFAAFGVMGAGRQKRTAPTYRALLISKLGRLLQG